MGTGNMEFDNVQLDVEFSQASERDNITSNENIALSFGKLSTWFDALVPEGGSSGQILGWKSSGTAKWINSPTIPTVNDGIFSIKKGSESIVTFSANQSSNTDLSFVEGSNVTITPNSTNRTVTIASVDEKVKVDKFVSTTQTDYLLTGAVASMATTAAHLVVDNADGVASARMRLQKGTTDTIGQSMLMLGNNIASGTSNNMQGMILMYSSSDKYGKIVSESLTDDRTWTLPDKTGTIAMTSDIPTVNNGKLTIKGGTTSVAEFTANQSSNTDFSIVAGSNVTITPDATNHKIKITSSDTKVTSATNHYTPSRDTSADKTASASGAAAAWSIDVVKGVTLNTDGKGHVTGISVTSGKIPANPNTDRYVNSAAFADDSANKAASPVKMTLTRAGSDSATIVANIPKVSSSSAGVAPKGATVSTQSQSTKFLREDGSWAAPSYTSIPSNNVTGSGTSGYLTKWNGTNTITNGPQLGSSTTTFLRNDGSWTTPTNTTYTIATGDSNGQIKVTPSSGSAYNVSVKGLASAAYVTQESLLRARSSVTTDGGATGWSQIGINQYNNAYPDGVTNKIYSYGAVVSMPAPNARFDLYYNHNSSTAGATTNGLQYRTGWNDDKKAWRMLIDNVNYTEYMPYKKPIKFQFNSGITNGYWAKLFSANYSSYNMLEIDIVTYHGYDGNFRSKLHIRFTSAGFVPGESSIISHQNIAPGSLRITQDDTNTFSLWIRCDGISSRFGYEILNISDESSVFFDGVTLTAARWSFPTTFTKSDTAPTNAVTATRYFALDNHTHSFADPTVTQTADNSSNSDNYELLISNSANNTTETAGARKSTRFRFNPSTGRVIMQGPLIVRATDGVGSYDEGIRINAGKNGYSSLSFGGGQDTISGTADGQFWVGTNSTNDSYKRKLYIAHAASTGSGTYFYASSATQGSPALKLGTSGSIASGNGDAVTGGVVYTALSNYLPLSGGSLSGSMNLKSTTYDGSAANNGVSSGISYPTTFNILDKSSRILVRLEGVINSSGSIGSYWYVRNYNTSGTHVGQKGISMTMAKDGTLTYAVSDGDKFRSAIGAGTSSLTIGTTSTTAAAGDHAHGLLHSDLTQAATNGTTGGWSVIGIDPAVTGYVLKSIRINEHSPNWLSGNYGAGIAFGGYDTKGVISMNYHLPTITFAGGNHKSSKTEPVWYFKISGTSGSTYNLANFYDSATSRTANTVLAAPNGSAGAATFRKLVAADLPSHTHDSLYGVQSSSAVPVTTLANGQLKVFYNVNNGLTGNMPATNNANAIIQINKHGGDYDSQLGFSSNGNIYYRSCNGTALSASVPWKRIYDTSNPPTASEVEALASTTKYAASSSVGGPALSVSTAGGDVILGTPSSSSDDSGDIYWKYGNGQEKARLWQDNTYTAKAGPTYRIYKSDGTALYNGRLPLADGTSASGTWGISITGSAATATRAEYLNVVASNEIRFYNDNQFKANNHFWIGYSWAAGSHYTPSGGSDTSSTTAPNITEFVMGNCSAGGLASVHAKAFILGNGSSPTKSSKTTTITTAATTTDRTITLPDDSGTVALTSKTFNVTRGSSVSTATSGYWAAMCNSSQTGSPVLPTSGKWWHVISMDWTNNDVKSWISQLAIATQDGSGVWWRRNDTGGTTINSYSWHRLAEGNSSGAATNVATEVGSSAGDRPVFYAYLGDNTRVVYNTNFTYNPSGNVLTATTFAGALSGNATSANKLNTNAGASNNPVYFSGGVPVACNVPASGSWFNGGIPEVRSGDGVMEIGKYIDFHATNGSKADYDYRIETSTTAMTLTAGGSTSNTLTIKSSGYAQLSFQTTSSGKAHTSSGIICYPLTASGMTALFNFGGNVVIGGGEAAQTLYDNDYDAIKTTEHETLYLASDSSELHLITDAQSYAGRKVLKILGGQLTKSGGSWIAARDNAPVHSYKGGDGTSGSFYPAIFSKSKNGGWAIGTLGNADTLYASYTKDTDYSSSTNTSTYTIQFPKASGTLALTADLDSYLPLSGGTMTGAIAYNNATTRLNSLKNLTNENVGTSATYFLTITNSWGKGGYTSVANAKTVLGMGTLASRSYVEITSITTVTTGRKYTCTANTNTYKTFLVIFSYGSTYMTQWFTITGSTAAYYPIFASMSTNAEAVLSVQCSAGASATITFQFSNGANSPVVEKVIGFNFGG